ncbi:MAG TPA: alpha/beta hydrolase [Dehalococcoidia bacterium]|nr:alpha/beta hydrolase [Dehalococcoidia bacterium]
MPTLSHDGCAIYYEVHGSGDPIVFAHGAGGSHLSWWQQVPHFRDRFTCVTFDHRGYGRSRADPEPDNGRHYVGDLAALIDHLGFESVNLIAQSMGGWTCLGYARRHPDRVRRLVMASTPGGLISPEIEAELAKTWSQPAPPPGSAPPAYGERMLKEAPTLAFLYDQIAGLNPPRDRRQIFALLRAIHTATADQVAGFTIPTLLIVGGEDASIRPDAIIAASRLIPGARLEVVPEAGHSLYFQYPDRFNQLVDSFLSA